MAFEQGKIYDYLDKIRTQLTSVIEVMDNASKEASTFDGEIARTIPLNLKSDIQKLIAILEGDDQSSIKNLVNYMDAIPLGALRKQSLTSTTINRGQLSKIDGNAEEQINTEPQNIPAQSEITQQNESVSLEDFYKENYKNKFKEQKYREDELSFDAIKNDDEMNLDNGEDYTGNEDKQTFDIQSIYDNDLDDSEHKVVESTNTEQGEKLKENLSIHNWKNIGKFTADEDDSMSELIKNAGNDYGDIFDTNARVKV